MSFSEITIGRILRLFYSGFINKAKDNFYKEPFCYWKNWTKLISGLKNNNE